MSDWKKVKIGDVCKIVKGSTGIASAEPGEYPLVVTAEERKSCSSYQFDCEAVCIPLVSSSGHGKKSLKNVHYQSGKFALGTILCAVIPNDSNELDARFLRQYLLFYKDTILVPLMKGAANVSLSMKDIATVEFPLPPIEKQRELSELFVSLQEKERILQVEYTKQFEYTKHLRQNILQDAIEGKLTEEWRKNNPVVKGNPDFDAEALFEKIQEEKCHTDSILLTQNQEKKKKGKSLDFPNPCGNTEKPFVIPEGWKWVKLGNLGNLSGGKRLPVGESFSPNETQHIYIRIKDMKNDSVELNDLKYISDSLAEKLKRYCIYKDELYITIAGTIGQVGIIPKCLDGMNLTENSSKFKPFIIENVFLKYFIKSEFIQSQFKNAVYGMALPKLALKRIASVSFPLPPLKEQDEIVSTVETLLAKVVELENQIQERKTLTKNLAFGIIKEKLEGK